MTNRLPLRPSIIISTGVMVKLSVESVSTFHLMWPWLGLGAAAILAFLLAGDRLRSDRSVSRWRDLSWLTWLAVCAYMIHQFEEHGVDVTGQAYAFRDSLCVTLGEGVGDACRIPRSFLTAVNVAAVWLLGPLCAVLARRHPAYALSFAGIPLVNGVIHLLSTVRGGAYNPGVLSSAVLFVPICLWIVGFAVRRGGGGGRAVLAALLGGLALHAVLLGSLSLYLAGRIGLPLLNVVQVLNPGVMLAAVFLATRSMGRKTAASAGP
jgi:hypothetical protein